MRYKVCYRRLGQWQDGSAMLAKTADASPRRMSCQIEVETA